MHDTKDIDKEWIKTAAKIIILDVLNVIILLWNTKILQSKWNIKPSH